VDSHRPLSTQQSFFACVYDAPGEFKTGSCVPAFTALGVDDTRRNPTPAGCSAKKTEIVDATAASDITTDKSAMTECDSLRLPGISTRLICQGSTLAGGTEGLFS